MNIIETNLSFGSMNTRSKTEKIILHHAASKDCTIEQIHNWHKNNGWAGVGYHFLVRKDGTIYRGRPEDKVGAHASGSNYNSIGICAEGNFEDENMSDVQKDSLIELVNYLKNKYNITKVQKHSDVNSTACPGKNYPFDDIVNNTRNDEVNVNNTIKEIQSKLNALYNTNLSIDGIYGVLTKKAMIKGLQTEFNIQLNANLTIDGIFGTNTKKACPTLKKGVSGNITYLVQAILVIKGYNITIDGIYGTNTYNIVKQFQSDNNLTSDGLCGKNTFEKLFK